MFRERKFFGRIRIAFETWHLRTWTWPACKFLSSTHDLCPSIFRYLSHLDPIIFSLVLTMQNVGKDSPSQPTVWPGVGVKKFFILKMGLPRPLFRLFLVFSNKQYNFYNKSMWRNVHSVYGAWIRTQDLSNMTTRPGLPGVTSCPNVCKSCLNNIHNSLYLNWSF